MGKHVRPRSERFGRCHFSSEMRKRACSCFKDRHFSCHHYDVRSIRHYKGHGVRGRRDPVWSAAYASFVQGFPTHQQARLPRAVSYKNFKDLVMKWYDSWDRGCDCTRGCERGSHVQHDVLFRLASLVSTGIEQGEGSWKHYEDIRDAADACPELSDLMAKYDLLPTTVHNLLVNKYELLKYTRPDVREKHAPSTHMKRQACSAIWGGRKPWLTLTSATRCQSRIDVYFEWDWYSHFTFMIDAVTFEDSEPAFSAEERKCYTLNGEHYPPHLIPRKPRIDSTNRAMFYIVLHPHEGVILGPDLMLTGSRVQESHKLDKDQIMKEWCASSCAECLFW